MPQGSIIGCLTGSPIVRGAMPQGSIIGCLTGSPIVRRIHRVPHRKSYSEGRYATRIHRMPHRKSYVRRRNTGGTETQREKERERVPGYMELNGKGRQLYRVVEWGSSVEER